MKSVGIISEDLGDVPAFMSPTLLGPQGQMLVAWSLGVILGLCCASCLLAVPQELCLWGPLGEEQQKEREKSEGKGIVLRQEETLLFTVNKLGVGVCWS